MCYYDHATMMAFKLGPWQENRRLRNFEMEAVIHKQEPCAYPARFILPRTCKQALSEQ